MLNIFKKEANCEMCAIVFPKNQLNYFDSTFRGERENGEKMRLCRDCLAVKLLEYLRAFKFRAIVVYPLKRFNAYQFYRFDEMGRYNFDQEYIENLRKFLPQDKTGCNSCNEYAYFTWCSPDIYFNNPFSTVIDTRKLFQREYLCGRCLAQKLIDNIKKENMSFNEFFPPVDGDGFCTSFEV